MPNGLQVHALGMSVPTPSPQVHCSTCGGRPLSTTGFRQHLKADHAGRAPTADEAQQLREGDKINNERTCMSPKVESELQTMGS